MGERTNFDRLGVRLRTKRLFDHMLRNKREHSVYDLSCVAVHESLRRDALQRVKQPASGSEVNALTQLLITLRCRLVVIQANMI